MKYILLLVFTSVALFSFGQGLILDSVGFEKLEKWEPSESYGYSQTSLPKSISFRKYTPMVLNQGDLSTCVGWAVSYAHLSTQQNILMNVTNETHKIFRSMDPNFIYSHIRDWEDKWCEKGTNISEAMKLLKNFGCKPMIWNPWLQCNSLESISEHNLKLAANYKIKEHFGIELDKNAVVTIKTALDQKNLVTIGMQLTESFYTNVTLSKGLWEPTKTEKTVGYHAMCIIGFDDNINGGSFEVMNSYGSEFGDEGYVWIKYEDFITYCKEAYIITISGMQGSSCSFGDCINSHSRYTFQNGEIYEGSFLNSKPNGYGSYVFANGDFYVGGFNQGRKHGDGLYYDVKSEQYFLVNFSNDVLISVDEVAGFVEVKSEINTEEIATILQKILPGKIVKESDENFKIIEMKQLSPEKPLERRE